MEEQTIDQRNLRDALGLFATGVTIVTTRTKSGDPEGLTVNSFNSLSLDPPMILWSLWKDTPNVAIFLESEKFAINILSSEQKHLSDLFSSSLGDRFSDVGLQTGASGIPLLRSCLAYFECSKAACHDGGDHFIFVGNVDHFQFVEGQPLIFFGGRYSTEGKQVHAMGEAGAPGDVGDTPS